MRVSVLDHGYVELVESWGSDERIIEAARMSTGKGFLGWGPTHTKDCAKEDTWVPDAHKLDCTCEPRAGDEKLLKYLWDHKHATPFEMAGVIFEVQAPIFVFREWHRHRTQSYNELSARYTPLPDMAYLPVAAEVVRRSQGASQNKQATRDKGAPTLTAETAQDLLNEEAGLLVMVEDLYRRKLAAGFPKELARTHLSVSRYSRMRASANLRNWLAFLELRSDKNPAAQWEIRAFANALGELVKQTFPRTYELFAGDRASK